jgi:hypothetical protein
MRCRQTGSPATEFAALLRDDVVLGLRDELERLARMRQVSLRKKSLDLYVDELSRCDLRDVREACRGLARISQPSKRSFPDLGALIEHTESAYRLRTPRPEYVPCGACLSGWIYVDAHGNPCGASESATRQVQACTCVAEWRAALRRWNAALPSVAIGRTSFALGHAVVSSAGVGGAGSSLGANL